MEPLKFESFSVEDIALLETWHFEKAWAQNYIFIHYEYIKNTFQDSYLKIKKLPKGVMPKSSESLEYISIQELKPIIKKEEYNKILIDLLLGSMDFYQINIILPFVITCEDLTKEQVNAVITEAVEKINFKRSFIAQRIMLDFVYKNKKLIQHELFDRILVDFPHTNFLNRII
jgi:hypothetical protein